ncbi:hypothetical protein BD410DRAFT_841858 [Rickenella mellea]|uniref:Uncharacterized protein n=1 Tax=Rickenella mellea TaxID=50990 RepID=A0A4Y7PWB5_9AGAM|nr:hypothetical protein BD410DRAFT_841858 [Rickenella mellea]
MRRDKDVAMLIVQKTGDIVCRRTIAAVISGGRSRSGERYRDGEQSLGRTAFENIHDLPASQPHLVSINEACAITPGSDLQPLETGGAINTLAVGGSGAESKAVGLPRTAKAFGRAEFQSEGGGGIEITLDVARAILPYHTQWKHVAGRLPAPAWGRILSAVTQGAQLELLEHLGVIPLFGISNI